MATSWGAAALLEPQEEGQNVAAGRGIARAVAEGAESVLLSFDENYEVTVAMAEAPHGTAPALEGKDLANPLAMILACGALLRHAADHHGPAVDRASRAIYESALEAIGSGIKTPDLGGNATTTEFTTEVVNRVATKIEVWSTLGSAA